MSPRHVAILLSLALLLAPAALAQNDPIAIDVSVLAGNQPVEEVEPGQPYVLQANVTLPEDTNASYRAFLNATLDGEELDPVQQQSSRGGTIQLIRTLNAPADAEGTLTIGYDVTVQRLVAPNGTTGNGTMGNETTGNETTGNETTGNGTTGNETTGNETEGNATAPRWETVETSSDQLIVPVAAPPAPPEGPPLLPLVGGALVLLLLIGGVVVYLRRPRSYQHESGHRSQTLQELEAEEGGGGGAAATVQQTGPEVHPQVKILEARKEDVRRMIELAQSRYERGDITEHQFNMIRQKKEAELQSIEEEIEGYRQGSQGQ